MSFLGPIGGILNVAGGFAKGAGAMQSATASAMSSNYQAIVAANNAILANEAADRTLQSGAIAAQNTSMKSAANVGSIKAAQGASGIDVNSGSALNVQSSAREMGQLATETTMNNAQERAWGYRVQASNDVAQAEMDQMTGKNQIAAGETAQAVDELGGLATGATAFGNQGAGTGLLGQAQALGNKALGMFGVS
jgi:hypothetical protein